MENGKALLNYRCSTNKNVAPSSPKTKKEVFVLACLYSYVNYARGFTIPVVYEVFVTPMLN